MSLTDMENAENAQKLVASSVLRILKVASRKCDVNVASENNLIKSLDRCASSIMKLQADSHECDRQCGLL